MHLGQRRAWHGQREGGFWTAMLCAVLLASSIAATFARADSVGSGPFESSQILPLSARDRNITWTGSVTSQGDGVMGGPIARSTFGVDGAGIKVGIISDSFNFLGGYNAGMLSNDLPGALNTNGYTTPVNIVNDELIPGNIDEGRAIAEIVHDLAPGAEILFHSAFNNPESSPGGSIAAAINNLVAAGADIIVDDVFDLRAPIYQDGVAAQAVNAAYASGVAYFSSAGNNSNNAYEAPFSPIFGTTHNFDANANEGGDNLFNFDNMTNGESVVAALWWDDAYATLGGTPTTDFDLGLYNVTDNVVVGITGGSQLLGQDPWEAFGFTNTSGSTKSFALFVLYNGGDPNKLLKIQILNQAITDDDDTNSPTTGGHNSAEGAMAVAAARFNTPNAAEPFTAYGPTTILRDEDGNLLAVPEIRDTPLITGIDGGNTTFFVNDSGIDADTFPNFFGTSASAPHVAAIAALMLERAAQLNHLMTPAELYELMLQSTIDIGAPGYDNITGFGRLDAFAAVSAVVPEPSALTMSLLAIVGCIGRGFRGRNRHSCG